MFGFPFVTSLIVVTALVTTLSFITNKGLTLPTHDQTAKFETSNHNVDETLV